jgi:hypothetical protein
MALSILFLKKYKFVLNTENGRCAESSTEEDSTTSHARGSTPKCVKPNVPLLAVLSNVPPRRAE